MKGENDGWRPRLRAGAWAIAYLIILSGLIVALLPLYNTFVATPETGAGDIYYACTSLKTADGFRQSIYYNDSSHVRELMRETGWSEEKVRRSLEEEYTTVSYEELEGLQRERVDTAIQRYRQYPTASIGNSSLNVSVQRSIGYDIDKLFVERNGTAYYCAMGYTGGV